MKHGTYKATRTEINYLEQGSYLTISANVKNPDGKRGLLHTVLDLNKIEQLNTFVIPTPGENYSGTNFCYLNRNLIAHSFRTRPNRPEPKSLIYLTDWNGKMLDTFNFIKGILIDDIEFASISNNIVIAGSYQDTCTSHGCNNRGLLGKINFSGDTEWFKLTNTYPYSYYANIEIGQKGDIYVQGRYVLDTYRTPVIIRKYQPTGVFTSSYDIYTHSYGHVTQSFELDENENPILLSNLEHSSIHKGFLHTFYDSKENVSSTTDHILESISIYPNPFQDYFRINGIKEQERFGYVVYNQLGQVMSKGESSQDINSQNFESGVYVIKVFNENTFTTITGIKI